MNNLHAEHRNAVSGSDALARKDIKRLFLAHRAELQAYLADRLRDAETAADLTQEAFLRFAEQREQVSVPHGRAYLYKTAHNLAIDHKRRLTRRRTDTVAEEGLAGMTDARPSPEEALASRQRIDILRAAVAELPLRTRQVFVLTRIETLTYREAAKRLGISESSVSKHLAQALRHVMKRIDG
jgi:RNA polymerase sigma-70 factor (ECF subfamily)